MGQDEKRKYRGFDGRGWICDSCGDIIETAKDGWVQWHSPEAPGDHRNVGQDLQLVHHVKNRDEVGGCQFDWRDPAFSVQDNHLIYFLGPDGLMRLLAFIAEGKIKVPEVLEMIKRLNVPNYEHTRLHLSKAIGEGVFEPNTLPGYPWQSDMEAITGWLKEQGDF